jgi:hypothetical protein
MIRNFILSLIIYSIAFTLSGCSRERPSEYYFTWEPNRWNDLEESMVCYYFEKTPGYVYCCSSDNPYCSKGYRYKMEPWVIASSVKEQCSKEGRDCSNVKFRRW